MAECFNYWDVIAALAQAIAAGIMLWAVFQTRNSIDISARTERIQTFMTFSKEYDLLKKKIPGRYFRDNNLLIEQGHLRQDWVYASLDLIKMFDRQHYLHAKGLVDDKVWSDVWEIGIRKNLKTNLFKWVLQQYPEHYTDVYHISDRFVKYAQNVIKESK